MNPGKIQDPANERNSPIAVDVLMLAYNVAPFIEAAVHGILRQRVTFPVRIVIAEDGSTDRTLEVCERLAEQHPGSILFLPGDRNIGVAARTAAGLRQCTAKYLAICDSDDIWTDRDKLADQVAFLESHPDHGLSYSDVEIIARDGSPVAQESYDGVRADYSSGRVFMKLVQGNFINNSTAVVRRDLLQGHVMDERRDHYVQDLLLWMQVAARTKVHFLARRTTSYRNGGISGNEEAANKAKATLHQYLLENLVTFDASAPTLDPKERAILFRKLGGVLFSTSARWKEKRAVPALLLRYAPTTRAGWRHVLGLGKVTLNTHHVLNNTVS